MQIFQWPESESEVLGKQSARFIVCDNVCQTH